MNKVSFGCLGLFIIIVIIGVIINAIKLVFSHIYGIFLILAIASLVLIFVGLFKPNVAFWSKKKTKKSASIGYLILTIVFLLLFGISASSQDTASKKNDTKTQTASTEMNNTKSNDSTSNDSSNDSKVSNTVASPSADSSDKKEAAKSASKTDTKKSTTPSNQHAVTLVETVDGDTIKVNYNGKVETVRYLLVDTPEEKKPGTCVQPYAVSAYNENKKLVNSGKLSLEFETNGDKRDKYGRLLAYVFVDGKSVQEELLKEGYARVAYIYNPPYKYLSKYQSDEKIAKNKHLNIWSQSGFVTDKGFNGCAAGSNNSTKSTTKNSSKSIPSSNTNSANSNQSSSSTTTSEQTDFANCTELRKVYPDGVPSTSPAYQSKMDRDHDNYACERN